MFKIYTSFEKQIKQVNPNPLSIVNQFDSSNVTGISKEYCIEIFYNNHRLFDCNIFTVEPWITYLSLMKKYFTNGYAEVSDLAKPIVYSFKQTQPNQLYFKLYHRLKNESKQIQLPEEEFMTSLFENLVKYLEYLRVNRPKYFQYWLKKYDEDLHYVATQIESNYLKV